MAVVNHRTVYISIHALREEGDASTTIGTTKFWNFYPRPPRGGRREHRKDRRGLCAISIHALREEGDVLEFCQILWCLGISIHALREEGDSCCLYCA